MINYSNKIISNHEKSVLVKIRATEVPGGNRRRRINNKAQQKTRKIGIFKV